MRAPARARVSPDFTQRHTLTTHSQTRTLAVFVAAAELRQLRSGREGFFPFLRATFPSVAELGSTLARLAPSLAPLWISTRRLPAVWSGEARRGAPVTGLSGCQRREARRQTEVRKLPSAVTARLSAPRRTHGGVFATLVVFFSVSGFGTAGGIPRARTATHADYPGCVIS